MKTKEWLSSCSPNNPLLPPGVQKEGQQTGTKIPHLLMKSWRRKFRSWSRMLRIKAKWSR